MVRFPPEIFRQIIEYVGDKKRERNQKLWGEICGYRLKITRDYNDITLDRLRGRNYIRRLYIYQTRQAIYHQIMLCGFNLDRVLLDKFD